MDPDTVTITKIEIQKKHKNRCSIFLDNEFAFGLDAAIVLQQRLKKGDQLSRAQIFEILLREEKQRVKEKAYQFLARRAHSEKELRTKLANKGFEQNLLDEVVSELRQQKLLDDAAFAKSFVRNRLSNKPLGEFALRQELRKKGVAEDQIKFVLQTAYADKDQIEYARELVQKKRPQYEKLDEQAKKKRLADFLIRRGFDWELVKEVVNERLTSED
jgi:regulatory protein